MCHLLLNSFIDNTDLILFGFPGTELRLSYIKNTWYGVWISIEKKEIKLKAIFGICLLIIVATLPAQAQNEVKENAKTAGIKEKLESKNYIFRARFVLPMRGPSRNLTSEYELEVSPEQVSAFLPYFGRAYTAPMDPSKGGVKFTSTDYDYKIKERKKGGWSVSIKPNDARDVRRVNLDISSDGYASLRVLMNSREPISYTGIIR